jgi:hypothetical protein
MSRVRWVGGVAAVTTLMFMAPGARVAAASTAAGLARCGAIAAPDARLACYDSLAGRAAERGAPTATATGAEAGHATAAGSGTSTSGTAAAGTGAASAATAALATAAAPAAPVARDDPRNFGFNQAQLHIAPPGGADAVHAIVSRITQDQLGRTTITLDNNQTWTYTDEDGRLSAGNAITIKRAALGSYLMTTPARRVYTVRRIQ